MDKTELVLIAEGNEDYFKDVITLKYRKYEEQRGRQIADINELREQIYEKAERSGDWKSWVKLPEIYELSQTLQAHLTESLYSNPEAMFDVFGRDAESQKFAYLQKSMLTNLFEDMGINNEIEKVIKSVVETGEATIFIGWERKKRYKRRSLVDNVLNPTEGESVMTYDGPRVKVIKSENFVFDRELSDKWDSCGKIYRDTATLKEVLSDSSYNLLTKEKEETIREFLLTKTELNGKESSGNCLSVTEYWGDISTPEGQILENMLITVVEDEFMVRFERNPYCINPFIYACIIEDPSTGRGISPLRAAVEISKFSSRILNKQLDALSLIMNPPYLAPKGSFQGEQKVTPGKIIEYDVSLMPEKPIPLSFEKALLGWDFIKFFKTETESVTGVFRNMSGDLRTDKRTATEVSYSVSGQAARLNSLLDSISRKIIIPIVERVADISAVFKIGSETIAVKAQDGTVSFSEITEEIRGGNYMYKYGDRKAMLERKYKLQELINTISSFSKLPEVANKINWMECFKFVLEQYGIENVTNFIATE